MNSKKNLQKSIRETIIPESITINPEISLTAKTGTTFTKIILTASLVAIGLFFNACTAGYVATEPSYVEYSRPVQPSSMHIWIDGDWSYRSQSHSYVQGNGHWSKPVQGSTYIKGSWQSTPKGHQYSKGYWEKEGKQQKRHNR